MPITEKKLERLVSNILNSRTDLIFDYKQGNKAAFNKLAMEVMKKTNSKADLKKIKSLLEKHL